MLWLDPNGKVHCKLFYSANVMKEFFQNGEEAGWATNTLFFWISDRGDNEFKVFGRWIQKRGNMY